MNLDNNFIYFLTERLTKSNVYPPLELAQNLKREDVVKAWQDLVSRVGQDDYRDHSFGLYLHLPFCPSKCLFCSCPSFVENNPVAIKKYVDSMVQEIDFFSPFLKDLEVKTIWVGGGTPSHLPLELIEKIIKNIFSSFKMHKTDWQFNFEASPQTLNPPKLNLLKEAGVSRLSMGVQSTFGKVLSKIGRVQSFDNVAGVVNYSRKIGIKHINLDYVAGLPGESLQSFLRGFTQIIKLRPDIIHLFAFHPTADTRFIKEGNEYGPKDVEQRSKMLKLGEKIIRSAGYKEIKNESWGLCYEARNMQDAAKKEVPCSVLGLGKFARSNISKILHYKNTPLHYDHAAGYEYVGCYLDKAEEMRHFLMGSLRGGFNVSDFKNIFNVDPLQEFASEFEYLSNFNKLKIEGELIRMMVRNTNEYHFLCKKLFYSENVLKRLREYFKDIYDQSNDYKLLLDKNFDTNF